MSRKKRSYSNGGKISEAVKLELIAKQGDSCNFCGEENLAESRKISFDHIIPFDRGGSGDINNLQILCRSCNSIKGTRSQKEFENYMEKREELPSMLDDIAKMFPEIADDVEVYKSAMPIERGYDFLKPLYAIIKAEVTQNE